MGISVKQNNKKKVQKREKYPSQIKQKDKLESKKEQDTNRSKKRFIIILFAIILVIILFCSGLGIYYYTTENNKITEIKEAQEKAFKTFSEEIKYEQEFSYDNLVNNLVDISKLQKNTNITIQIEDKQLSKEETFKFEKLGTYTVKVKLEYVYTYSIMNSLTKNIENVKSFNIDIKDKEKPVISGVANKEIFVGENINLQDGITATDNVDGEVEIKIDGTVDKDKTGNYDIKVIASDKSGNVEEATFTVTVKEKPKENNNTSYSNKNQNNSGSATVTNSSKDYIADILKLTNQYRSEAGVKAVTLDSKLSEIAQKRATELVSSQSHTRPNGTNYHTIFEEYGMAIWISGENLAYGQSNGVDAVNWWKNSPGHYKTMIYEGYTKIGIGAYYSGGKWYWIQIFTS